MPRNMSFAMTTRQFRNRSKTVTRRLGWSFVKHGDIVNGCVKCMGLKPGEKIKRLGQIRIIDARREPLMLMETVAGTNGKSLRAVQEIYAGVNYPDDYGNIEAAKEGFPGMTGSEFVAMFCQSMRVKPHEMVTRIEFEYIDPPEARDVA